MATYPFNKFRYKVDIPDLGVAGFSEVTGFDASIDVIEYRNGDEKPPTPAKLPGLRKYSNVTFKWGVTESKAVYEWFAEWMDKSSERKDVTVTLLDDEDAEQAAWTITAAWPVKYTAPEFNATSSEVAIEQVEVAHEGLKRTK
ncbi:MAG: phage tail protein [Clostridiales Family XIII bacterium]|jgi:phage tail-like protein|nr:phage tail protein [Clostridiales Family XIII bacterium]